MIDILIVAGCCAAILITASMCIWYLTTVRRPGLTNLAAATLSFAACTVFLDSLPSAAAVLMIIPCAYLTAVLLFHKKL